MSASTVTSRIISISCWLVVIRVILLQSREVFESLLFNLAIYQIIFMSMHQQEQEISVSETQFQGRWTSQEHNKFIKALMAHGKNWKLIETGVETRTTSQVRSHAQKFFLKIVKMQKQRKRNLKKGITSLTSAEQQLIKSLCQQTITPDTPPEILHFLKREQKKESEKRQDTKEEAPEILKEQIKKRTSQILEEMLQANDQSSFLVSLMYQINRYSKHNMNFLGRDQAFTQLIDLPIINTEEKEEEETTNKRKKSFSFYDQEEDRRYTHMLKKMRGE